MNTPVTLTLDAQGIPYRVFTHTGQIHSLEQAAQERGQRPEQVIRSILFRLANDQFVMVLTRGSQQSSWLALRQHLGVTRMSMASADEVLERTGYLHGAVSPFRLPAPMRILVIILFAASLISGCAGEVITTPIKLVDPDAKNTPALRIAATATSKAMVKATITPTATVITATVAASYTPTVTATETLTPTMTSTMTPTVEATKEKEESGGGDAGGGLPPGGSGGPNS